MIKRIWRVVCYPFLYLALQTVVTIVYTFAKIFGNTMGIVSEGEFMLNEEYLTIPALEEMLAGIHLVTPMLITGVLFMSIAFLTHRTKWSKERFFAPAGLAKEPVTALLAFVLGITLNLLTMSAIYFTAAQGVNIPDSYNGLIEMLLGGSMLMEILVIGVFIPVVEEVIFRGIVFDRLKTYMALPMAIFTQALIFGCIHGNLLQGLYAAILGIVMGLVCHWLNSIWAPILIHVTYNSTSLLMFYALGSEDFTPMAYGLFLISGIVVSGILTYLLYTKKSQALNITDRQDGGGPTGL